MSPYKRMLEYKAVHQIKYHFAKSLRADKMLGLRNPTPMTG